MIRFTSAKNKKNIIGEMVGECFKRKCISWSEAQIDIRKKSSSTARRGYDDGIGNQTSVLMATIALFN
jgi:hypothetical protein